jgi:iron complex outermembrane receptor protein
MGDVTDRHATSALHDEVYVASCFGEANCFYGERRTVLGTVTYRW